MRDLTGALALVTGGAGGIGQALARALAAAGARPVLTDLSDDALRAASDALRQDGVEAPTYACDVTDPIAVEATRDLLHREHGPVRILVNNAGVVFGGPFLDVPLERHRATYRVNVEGVVIATYVFLPDLIAAGSGQVVNLASVSGFVGLPYASTYASSKWAVIGFGESIRQELEKQGHRGIGVTTVCPGYVETGMFEGAKAPRLMPYLTPSELADKVVDAVRHDKAFVLEPWLAKVTPLLAHGLPTRVADRLSDLFGASTSMATWRGRRGGPGPSRADGD